MLLLTAVACLCASSSQQQGYSFQHSALKFRKGGLGVTASNLELKPPYLSLLNNHIDEMLRTLLKGMETNAKSANIGRVSLQIPWAFMFPLISITSTRRGNAALEIKCSGVLVHFSHQQNTSKGKDPYGIGSKLTTTANAAKGLNNMVTLTQPVLSRVIPEAVRTATNGFIEWGSKAASRPLWKSFVGKLNKQRAPWVVDEFFVEDFTLSRNEDTVTASVKDVMVDATAVSNRLATEIKGATIVKYVGLEKLIIERPLSTLSWSSVQRKQNDQIVSFESQLKMGIHIRLRNNAPFMTSGFVLALVLIVFVASLNTARCLCRLAGRTTVAIDAEGLGSSSRKKEK